MKHVFLILCASLLLFSSCSAGQTDVTREEIVAAYEDAGYTVWTRVYDEKLDYGEIAFIQANHPDGDYIYFSFFETEADAQAWKKDYYHPMATWLFSVIYGDPLWVRCEVYGTVMVQYDDPELYQVFENLIKKK